MPSYVVTGTSMEVDADTPEEAVQRADQMSGWHWEAEEVDEVTRHLNALCRGDALVRAALDILRDRGEIADQVILRLADPDELYTFFARDVDRLADYLNEEAS